MIKKCFIDLETTGVDYTKHGIIEIACIFEVGGLVDEFVLECRPFEDDIIDEEALAINNVSKDDLFKRMSPKDAYRQLTQKLSRFVDKYDKKDKLHFIGYSALFDANFLRQFFLKNGDSYFGSFFFYPIIDVATLAGLALMEERPILDDFKLPTVAERFGIRVEKKKLHGALYDIQLTRDIFYAVIKSFKRWES